MYCMLMFALSILYVYQGKQSRVFCHELLDPSALLHVSPYWVSNERARSIVCAKCGVFLICACHIVRRMWKLSKDFALSTAHFILQVYVLLGKYYISSTNSATLVFGFPFFSRGIITSLFQQVNSN